jgi:hypothetical protein
VPGSAGYPVPYGITPQGDVVGTYGAVLNNKAITCGFLLSKGTFTNIDVNLPGAVPGSTNADAINPQGDIVGFYASDNGNVGFGFDEKGFPSKERRLYRPRSPWVSITLTYGINPQGDILGFYTDNTGKGHGFS